MKNKQQEEKTVAGGNKQERENWSAGNLWDYRGEVDKLAFGGGGIVRSLRLSPGGFVFLFQHSLRLKDSNNLVNYRTIQNMLFTFYCFSATQIY